MKQQVKRKKIAALPRNFTQFLKRKQTVIAFAHVEMEVAQSKEPPSSPRNEKQVKLNSVVVSSN